MGAVDFATASRGKTIADAFASARAEAQYEVGHGGYTGTIAEKHGYREFPLPQGIQPRTLIQWVEDEEVDVPEEHRAQVKQMRDLYHNKFGPAVAVPIGEGRWLFFGLASS